MLYHGPAPIAGGGVIAAGGAWFSGLHIIAYIVAVLAIIFVILAIMKILPKFRRRP